jgi:hypothetical protein
LIQLGTKLVELKWETFMSSTKHISAFAAVALAALTLTATAQATQATPAEEPTVSSATPATISQVLAATQFTHSNVFIAVCNPQSPACREFLQAFRLNAALVQGGWTGGVQNMHSSEFFSLDATASNSQALSKVCAMSGLSALEKTSCQALAGAMPGSPTPQLIMINRKTGAVQVVKGFTDQPTQSRAIVSFLKK